ncbi:MAG: nicotinate (nicotinamide) nucleotide adenylyltransferase [Clostridiales bacterium]|nr:nicotinate (nicotinamide) nucleotide adenylyltransferase [Clostridiales bacterium]
MNKKLVFFGGTFDPPHVEHYQMVKECINELSPDKIIIMPTFIPPHKQTFMVASAKDRLKMCEEAFGSLPTVEVSDWELKQKGKSFSYITMQYLASNYPDYKIYFLMGTDMLSSFDKWKNPTEILKYATPLLCERTGEGEKATKTVDDFKKKFQSDVETLSYVGKDLSSTEIKIKNLLKMNLTNEVLPSVNRLIDRLSLYSCGNLADFTVENLTENRIEHTKGVISLALKYAKIQGVNLKKTLISALLHDVAKYLNPSDYKDFKMPKGVPQPVVHQYLGAYVAEKVLGVKDKEIIRAIRYHTSAKPNMSKLGKIIFTADMLEEGRTYDGVDQMREISFKDFEKGFVLSLKRSLEYIKIRGVEIYPLTQKAYEYYTRRK